MIAIQIEDKTNEQKEKMLNVENSFDKKVLKLFIKQILFLVVFIHD